MQDFQKILYKAMGGKRNPLMNMLPIPNVGLHKGKAEDFYKPLPKMACGPSPTNSGNDETPAAAETSNPGK